VSPKPLPQVAQVVASCHSGGAAMYLHAKTEPGIHAWKGHTAYTAQWANYNEAALCARAVDARWARVESVCAHAVHS